MNLNQRQRLSIIILFIMSHFAQASPDRTQLTVWANEAIVATYTFNHQNYLQRQKEIAQYFTADGWITYSKALNASKLPEAVQKNAYDVTAVATQPPQLITLDPTHWQVIMPVLVVYQNPQYQQRQYLKVLLSFAQAPAGQGVRGFSATSLQATLTEPPCRCANEKSKVSAKQTP